MEKKDKKSKNLLRRASALIATLLLVAAAVLLLLYRDRLTAEGIRDMLSSGETNAAESEAYTYETGAEEMFAPAGNGLAVVSSSGMQLLNADGETVVKQVFSLETPAVAASAELCAFYDVGGTTLRCADFSGTVTNLDPAAAIISVTVNDSGWLAVVTEETGYKGLVTVYNRALEPVYQWHAGSGYVLSARVSPDCRSMIALTAGSSGSTITLFSLSSETPQGSFTAPDELLIDMAWLSAGRIAAISESRLVLLDSALKEQGQLDFQGMYLTDYTLEGENFAAVLLGKYRSGNAGVLLTVDGSGTELGRLELQRDLVSLSAGGEKLLALYSDELVLYSDNMEQLGSCLDVVGLRGALLREKGDCYLLSSYAASVYKF